MEVENVVVNGNSHDLETEEPVDEKVLKPRKSLATKETVETIQNGTGENGSNSDDEPKLENGHDEALEEEAEKSKSTKTRNLRGPAANLKKESTPKPDSPVKRELRPRETTPKPDSTPGKRKGRSTRTPVKSPLSEDTGVVNGDDKEKKDLNGTSAEDSSVVFEAVTNNDDSVVIIENSIEEVKPQSTGYFSLFRKSFTSKTPSGSPSVKDKPEPIISSPICLDTPPIVQKFTPSSEVKGRKPIDPFFRFSGKSFGSDSSMKRKAEESYNGDESGRKRFAGETESGSEQSPGWSFVSPFRKKWSPRHQKPSTPLPSSTPFSKGLEQDSMAVNYGDDSSLSLGESAVNGFEEAPASLMRRCSIM